MVWNHILKFAMVCMTSSVLPLESSTFINSRVSKIMNTDYRFSTVVLKFDFMETRIVRKPDTGSRTGLDNMSVKWMRSSYKKCKKLISPDY